MFNKPNTVPVPDELFDQFLKELTPAETKVILTIIRKTYGYHKVWDCISISQLMEMTNLSDRGISDCIASLIGKKYINSQYVCNCGILLPTYDSKIFQCKKCHTKEAPNKYYTLNTGEDFGQYLKDTLHIVNRRINRCKNVDKKAKGSELSSGEVLNSVQGGVLNSVHRQETIPTRNNVQETSPLLSSSSLVRGPTSQNVGNSEKEKKDYYDPLGKKEPTEEEIKQSESDIVVEERFQRIKQLFKENCTSFNLGGKPRVVAFRKILEYPDEKIRIVVERAGEYGTDSSHILSWVRKGLEDYDRLYDNNQNEVKSSMYREFEPMDEEHRSQLIEGMERKRLRDVEATGKVQFESVSRLSRFESVSRLSRKVKS